MCLCVTLTRGQFYWLILCQLDTGWSYHRKRSFSWWNASTRSSCKAFSQLVIKVEFPLWVVPSGSLGSIREQDEQARGSKPVKNIPHGFCISSCFLTCLSSSPDFLWWWAAVWRYKLNKPFPPQLASLSWCLWQRQKSECHLLEVWPCWNSCDLVGIGVVGGGFSTLTLVPGSQSSTRSLWMMT